MFIEFGGKIIKTGDNTEVSIDWSLDNKVEKTGWNIGEEVLIIKFEFLKLVIKATLRTPLIHEINTNYNNKIHKNSWHSSESSSKSGLFSGSSDSSHSSGHSTTVEVKDSKSEYEYIKNEEIIEIEIEELINGSGFKGLKLETHEYQEIMYMRKMKSDVLFDGLLRRMVDRDRKVWDDYRNTFQFGEPEGGYELFEFNFPEYRLEDLLKDRIDSEVKKYKRELLNRLNGGN